MKELIKAAFAVGMCAVGAFCVLGYHFFNSDDLGLLITGWSMLILFKLESIVEFNLNNQ